MRACKCDGTGFIPEYGNYRTKDGATVPFTQHVYRCPGYREYFDSSPAMKDYPQKVPVKRFHGACEAAIKAHLAMFDRGEKTRKDGKEL